MAHDGQNYKSWTILWTQPFVLNMGQIRTPQLNPGTGVHYRKQRSTWHMCMWTNVSSVQKVRVKCACELLKMSLLKWKQKWMVCLFVFNMTYLQNKDRTIVYSVPIRLDVEIWRRYILTFFNVFSTSKFRRHFDV